MWELREERLPSPLFAAPEDTIARSLAYVVRHPRAVTPGSFVFCLSDFLDPPPVEGWLTALEHRFDIVPVVIQDPMWEQSFPEVSGIVCPLRDPRTRRLAEVRLTRREVAARRHANEERLQELLSGLGELGLDPVLVSSADPVHILAAFLEWAELPCPEGGVTSRRVVAGLIIAVAVTAGAVAIVLLTGRGDRDQSASVAIGAGPVATEASLAPATFSSATR